MKRATSLAFLVAKPVEHEEPTDMVYDPQTQTAVWYGDNYPQAGWQSKCTFRYFAFSHCKKAGPNQCRSAPTVDRAPGYRCDR